MWETGEEAVAVKSSQMWLPKPQRVAVCETCSTTVNETAGTTTTLRISSLSGLVLVSVLTPQGLGLAVVSIHSGLGLGFGTTLFSSKNNNINVKLVYF